MDQSISCAETLNTKRMTNEYYTRIEQISLERFSYNTSIVDKVFVVQVLIRTQWKLDYMTDEIMSVECKNRNLLTYT